jgi:hypothetical protein
LALGFSHPTAVKKTRLQKQNENRKKAPPTRGMGGVRWKCEYQRRSAAKGAELFLLKQKGRIDVIFRRLGEMFIILILFLETNTSYIYHHLPRQRRLLLLLL